MHSTFTQSSIATRLCNCVSEAERSYRYKVTIVSDRLELDAREMPIPQDYQTIEVWARLAQEIPALVAVSHPGYKVVDFWQPIEEECPF